MRIHSASWLGPDWAFLLLIAGLFLVYWELCRPGTVLPGAIGSVLVFVASARCAAQPGFVWMMAGFVVLLCGAWSRWLGLVGVILFCWGAIRMGVRWWLAGPLSLVLGAATVWLAWAALEGFLAKRRLM